MRALPMAEGSSMLRKRRLGTSTGGGDVPGLMMLSFKVVVYRASTLGWT